jgi:hypothetical protein
MARSKPPIKQKNIETPERMMELFLAYKEKVKSNPILKHDFVGGAGKSVQRKIERPLTLEGFSVYCFELGIIKSVHDYFKNLNDAYNSYSPICHTIKEIIRQDQIEGGMAGIYNPSITQRLNNLVEKQETKVSVEQPLFPD